MSWPRVDYHTHICAAPIDAMLAAAEAAGVREYGISEHIFQLDEGHPIFPQQFEEGERFAREWYVAAVRERAGRSPVDVRLGLEVDYLPGTEDAVTALLAGVEWDYLIGSIHEIGPVDIFLAEPEDAAHGEALWRQYYALFVAAIESGAFDVVSHPVRNALLNPHLPGDFDDLLDEVAACAASNGVAIELNGEDTSRWPELVERLARACARAGCPVSLGSDAHRPATVARSLQRASEIARAAGVPGVVSFQRRDRRVIPFD